ncbi:MAG: hypothetical protein ACTSU5_12110 [Promethearchaeota archaeon]
MQYKKQLGFEVKNVLGEDARAYKLFQNAVVVNKDRVFNNLGALEDFLREYFDSKRGGIHDE